MELELKEDPMMNRKFWKATGDKEEFKCSQCRKEIKEGYMCENDKKIILCKDCQDKFNMSRCKHNIIGEHKHIKWEV
jgi:NAD-dependent SIR2 family protein deacetylase